MIRLFAYGGKCCVAGSDHWLICSSVLWIRIFEMLSFHHKHYLPVCVSYYLPVSVIARLRVCKHLQSGMSLRYSTHVAFNPVGSLESLYKKFPVDLFLSTIIISKSALFCWLFCTSECVCENARKCDFI